MFADQLHFWLTLWHHNRPNVPLDKAQYCISEMPVPDASASKIKYLFI